MNSQRPVVAVVARFAAVLLLLVAFLAVAAKGHAPDPDDASIFEDGENGLIKGANQIKIGGSADDDDDEDDEEDTVPETPAAPKKPHPKVKMSKTIRPHLFHPARDEHPCDRELCREARVVLNKDFFPLVQEKEYELPPGCPLSTDNDRFYSQEKLKSQMRNGNYKCSMCSKIFKSEEYVDKHMDNRHRVTLPDKPTVCLADLCDILHCPSVEEDKACHNHQMLYKRTQCQSVLHSCFPADQNDKAHDLYDEFNRLFCSHLSCDEAATKSRWAKRLGNVKEDKPPVRRVMYWIMVVMVIFLVLLFYIGMCLWNREVRFSSDLRRLSSSRQANRLKFWQTAPKVKGY